MRRQTMDCGSAVHDGPVDATADTPAESAWSLGAALRGDRGLEGRLTSWLLRGGLAFVLLYAAISSLVHPETFAQYFPSFLPATMANQLLPVFAVYETILAVSLMTHRYACVASALAGLTMVAIIATNPRAFDVLFRNVAIACGAFALAVQSRGEHRDGKDTAVDGGDPGVRPPSLRTTRRRPA